MGPLGFEIRVLEGYHKCLGFKGPKDPRIWYFFGIKMVLFWGSNKDYSRGYYGGFVYIALRAHSLGIK